MRLNFMGKRKMFRVLNAAKTGIYAEAEIAERAGMALSSIRAPLCTLERTGYMVSGTLVPGEVKIYRVTSKGQQALARGQFS